MSNLINRKVRLTLDVGASNERKLTVAIPDSVKTDVISAPLVAAKEALAAMRSSLFTLSGRRVEDGTTNATGKGQSTGADVLANINGHTDAKSVKPKKVKEDNGRPAIDPALNGHKNGQTV